MQCSAWEGGMDGWIITGACDSVWRGGGGACEVLDFGWALSDECAERAVITLIGIARRRAWFVVVRMLWRQGLRVAGRWAALLLCAYHGGGGGVDDAEIRRCAKPKKSRRQHRPAQRWSGVRLITHRGRDCGRRGPSHYFGRPGRLGRRNALGDGSAVVMPAVSPVRYAFETERSALDPGPRAF